jgi:hypothetical protein
VTLNCYGYTLDNTGGNGVQVWEYYDCEGNYLTINVPAFDSYYIMCARPTPTKLSGPVGPVPGEDFEPCGSYCEPGSPSATPSVTPTPSGPPNG